MLLDKEWWEEFWKSPEGQELKAIGDLETTDAESILFVIRKRYEASNLPVPDYVLKAFEED